MTAPRALVACERSGRVRSALRRHGVDAWSCDLVPADDNSEHHIVGDAASLLDDGWDLLIAHPPCTHLAHVQTPCESGACKHGHPDGWVPVRAMEAIEAARLFNRFLHAPIPRRCVENPQPSKRAKVLLGKPTQWIEPFHHGDPIRKRTGLWLRGLPELTATAPVVPTHTLLHYDDRIGLPGLHRDPKKRSETQPGIAEAMAAQWAPLLTDDWVPELF